MLTEKKLLSLFCNQDDDVLHPDEVLWAANMRRTYDRWESLPSTLEIANDDQLTDDVVIGAGREDASRYLGYFVYNPTAAGNKIFLYYRPSETFWTVLTGGDLNFSKDSLVQASIQSGILYWT